MKLRIVSLATSTDLPGWYRQLLCRRAAPCRDAARASLHGPGNDG
jgi:hypothetical protein